MKLNLKSLENRKEWEDALFELPRFDVPSMKEETRARPVWVHMGAGNIFRAFMANVWQQILNERYAQAASDADNGGPRPGWPLAGIVAADGYDYEIARRMYEPHDNLGVLVTLKADGGIEKTVIASIAESYALDRGDREAWGRMCGIFRNPSLQMVSFTITEKGYSLKDATGKVRGDVEADFAAGPGGAESYVGKIAALLHERYMAGGHPVAMVSMDNCSHNGDKLFGAVEPFAKAWADRGLAEPGFYKYITDPGAVSFPWSMIDKITPRPDDSVKQMLAGCGFEDAEGILTSKNTYVATFVNAEEPQYLVIEDAFPGGRPPLEEGGVIFTDRETVNKVERMKVCTCLNPLHTAMATFGCLLGYSLISEEMKNPRIHRMLEQIGYREGLPVVTDPGILSPRAFIDEVINVRLTNPFMPDTPQRIVEDTSHKVAIRFGETIKAYMADSKLDAGSLKGIPFAIAGWCRYLMGVDDGGDEMGLSPDPMLGVLCPRMAGITLGEKDTAKIHGALRPILSDVGIFGVDLYEAGLGSRVEEYFAMMCAGPGAVEETLCRVWPA
ncbi:MAG: mannitol dehydrogenase family protein [Lachnospiraceae bacterium]|jgi:fructuronate reductase|nr:mannitol dehydrogenase family protein [Lachnospiraceae bacterium]